MFKWLKQVYNNLLGQDLDNNRNFKKLYSCRTEEGVFVVFFNPVTKHGVYNRNIFGRYWLVQSGLRDSDWGYVNANGHYEGALRPPVGREFVYRVGSYAYTLGEVVEVHKT